jgi:glucose/arabinose dehydrogenase
MTRTFLAFALMSLTGCTYLGQIAWQAADQAGRYSANRLVVDDITAPGGFRVVRVVNGLNFPSAFTWDDAGNLYILESHTVPAPMLKAKIVRVGTDGRIDRFPWNAPGETAIGLTFHDGWLYVSHEEKDGTFSISRVRPSGGTVETVVAHVPVQGDHDVNHLAFDRDGTLYFGVGSATNSGVVAADDPVNERWLPKFPQARDTACRDITLTGRTFTDGKGVVTGAYQAHGRFDARTIRGEPMCMTSIHRLRPGSSTPELVAWGFRNPVALAFERDGTLLVGMQGADVRGSRPVKDDPDSILRVRPGTWYGWPDYNAALRPLAIPPIIDLGASGLTAPDRSLLVAATEPHAAISGMTVAPDGGILVAEMGDFKPQTDPGSPTRAGFQIERIAGGSIAPFLRNRNEGDAEPASTLDLRNGFERPVDVRIGPDGLIYVLDFGAFVTKGGEPKAFPKTGKLFRVEPVQGR